MNDTVTNIVGWFLDGSRTDNFVIETVEWFVRMPFWILVGAWIIIDETLDAASIIYGEIK